MALPFTLVFMLLFGYAGYRIFHHFHMPAAGLIGAMLTTALAALLGFPWGEIPPALSVALQCIVGVMIGFRFSREGIKRLRHLLLPALAVAFWMVATGVVVGHLLADWTRLSLSTAMFSAAPGGITEMSIIALSYDADVGAVALLQFIRVMGTYALVPLVTGFIRRRKGLVSRSHTPQPILRVEGPARGWSPVWSLLLAWGAGYTAWALGVPAGGIIGAMVVIAILRIREVPLTPLPAATIRWAQIGLGGILGLRFDPNMVGHLGELLLPVLLLTLLLMGSGLLLAWIMHRLFRWDLTTCLLASAAAGLSQMAIIALEMEADSVKVSMLHLVRIVTIILVLPPLIAWMLQ